MRLSKPRLGLMPKIVAWSFIPAALILLGFAFITIALFQTVLEALMIENNRETTEVMAGQIGADLETLADELSDIARTPGWLDGDVAATRAGLQVAPQGHGIFDGGLVVLNQEGIAVAAEPTGDKPIPEDWSHTLFFRQILASPDPVLSDMFFDSSRGAYLVSVAVPIKTADGQFLGAIAGLLRVNSTSMLTRRLARYQSWPSADEYDLANPGPVSSALLVDRNGGIVFHSDASQIGRNVSSETAVQSVLAGRHGPISSAEFRDRPTVTYFAPIPHTGWGFLIEQERSSAIGFYRRYFEMQTAAFALALVIPASLVAFGARRITQPIRKVTAASRQIAAGDLQQTIHVKTGDELEELANQFNLMSVRLRESYTTLKEREERLALVIQATNDGIWDWDLKTDQVYFSPRWKAMLGYADDEIGNTFDEWRRLLHPHDVQRALTLIQEYVEGKTCGYELEHRLRHKDGSYRWVLAHGVSLLDAEGKPYRIVGSHTDITDRKRIEEQLHERLAFERLITRISTEFINLDAGGIDAGIQRALQAIGEFERVDRSYVFLISNDGTTMDNVYEWCASGIESFMARLRSIPMDTFPWSAERLRRFEVVHVPSLGALPPEASAEKREFALEGIKSLINVPVAYRGQLVGFLGLDSVAAEKTWSEDTIALLRIAGEIFANALEHKREQETLVQSEVRFRMLFEESSAGIVITDGPIQRVNHAAEAIMGYTEDELAHMQPREYIHPDDIAEDERLHAESEAGLRNRYQMEKRYCHRDGRMVWARYTHTILRDASSQPLLHFAVMEDITERRKAEAELRRANESLERRVQERTRELAALNSIAGVVSQSLDLKEIMQDALNRTVQVCGMDVGSAYELEDNSRELLLTASQGRSEEFRQSVGERVPLEAALPGQSLSLDRPLVWQVAHDYPEGEAKNGILREGIASLFAVPLVAKSKIVGAFAFGSKTRRVLTMDESALLLAIGRQVGIALENARLYTRVRERHGEAERRRLVAEGMREIIAVLNSKQTLQAILDFIASQACRVLASDAAIIFRLQEKDGPLVIQSTCGVPDSQLGNLRFSIREGATWKALLERQPQFISDAAGARRSAIGQQMPANPERAWALQMFDAYPGVLAAPLIVKGEDYGVLTLFYSSPRTFSDEEISLASAVANQAALAIENARLHEQAQQRATTAERSRLARELHDSVTQSLYSVMLYAEAAARSLADKEMAEAGDFLRELRDTAQDALREMRLLIFELRPPTLEKDGLIGALRTRLNAVEGRGGIKTELHVNDDRLAEQLPLSLQEALYHIVQEALNNVIRHAHAQSVRVGFHFSSNAIELQVSDDGIGFDPENATQSSGLGLRGMRERVQHIGGSVQLTSGPRRGTRVLVWVPNVKAHPEPRGGEA